MGLAGFNRMRRLRKPVETVEAERFVASHQAREGARKARLDAHRANKSRLGEVRELETDAMQRAGELIRAGLDNNDVPMRREHAAEIAGRNLEGVQDPKDPVARVGERIPDGTHNEELVDKMLVSGPGPDEALLNKAREEAGVQDPNMARRARGARVERQEGDQREARPKAQAGEREPKKRRQQAAPSETERSAILAKRAEVEIPANWRDIGWAKQRSLAAKVKAGDGKIKTRPEAISAIEAEIKRRG